MNAPERNHATRVFDAARVMVRVADLVVRCSWLRKSPQFGYGLPSASGSGLRSTPGANEHNPVAKTTGSLNAHLSQYCQACLTAFWPTAFIGWSVHPFQQVVFANDDSAAIFRRPTEPAALLQTASIYPHINSVGFATVPFGGGRQVDKAVGQFVVDGQARILKPR